MKVEELLDDLAEGRKAESSGHFELDPSKAIEKMASFAFPEPNWWALKLIQGAVAAGAEFLEILYRADQQLCIEFTSKEHWTTTQLHSAFINPQVEKSRALQHFKQGLWSCWKQAGLAFSIQLSGDSSALRVDSNTVEIAKGDGSAGKATVVKVHLDGPATSIIETILKRAYLCPMRITSIDKHQKATAILPQQNVLHWQSIDSNQLNPLKIPSVSPERAPEVHSFRQGRLNRSRSDVWRLTSMGRILISLVENPTSGWLSERPKFQDEIRWIDDGVWIDSDPLWGGESKQISVAAHAAIGDLALDISGAGLVRNPEREALCQKIREATNNHLNLDCLRGPDRIWKSMMPSIQLYLGFLALAFVGGFFTLKGPMGGAAGVVLAAFVTIPLPLLGAAKLFENRKIGVDNWNEEVPLIQARGRKWLYGEAELKS